MYYHEVEHADGTRVAWVGDTWPRIVMGHVIARLRHPLSRTIVRPERPNAETIAAMRAADAGEGLTSYASVDAMFRDILGDEEDQVAVSGCSEPAGFYGEQVDRHVTVVYRNHRGVVGNRTIRPIEIRFDATEFHPEPQWLLEVWDVGKGQYRTFAMKDILEWRPAPGVTENQRLAGELATLRQAIESAGLQAFFEGYLGQSWSETT